MDNWKAPENRDGPSSSDQVCAKRNIPDNNRVSVYYIFKTLKDILIFPLEALCNVHATPVSIAYFVPHRYPIFNANPSGLQNTIIQYKYSTDINNTVNIELKAQVSLFTWAVMFTRRMKMSINQWAPAVK